MDDKESLWSELIGKIESCTKCPLHRYRKKAVPGEGSLYSKMLLLGEAPGQREDEEGRPFVGAAGKLLTELLESRGIKRDEVFITNVVKCRPPNNREPRDDEVIACSEYTLSIIKLVDPKLVVTLGNHAGKFVFKMCGDVEWRGISKMRGKLYTLRLREIGVLTVIPTYHPATALYNPNVRYILETDFDLVRSTYMGLTSKTLTTTRATTLLDFISK